MGMNLSIYTKNPSSDLIPKIIERFSEHHMLIEFHPDFSFDEGKDQGFLPIKFRMKPGYSTIYDQIDHDIISGFELIFSEYDYNEDLMSVQEQNTVESRSLLSKLFGGGKKSKPAPETFVASMELDKLLKNCRKSVLLDWKSWNKSELRVSLYFAAILADLTDGVIYDPQSGRFLTGSEALESFPQEIEEYENSFKANEFTVDRFDGWK